MATCDSDIEPDELVPEYITTKSKLLQLERTLSSKGQHSANADDEMAVAKLEAKLRKIESDVLFDKFVAEQQWMTNRVAIEKELALTRQLANDRSSDSSSPEDNGPADKSNGDINDEAERIAAEILAEGDNSGDDDIGSLFASLPQNEVDPITGASQTVINSANGQKIVIRDFGKWTGMSPRRILEEACRSRYGIKDGLQIITC